MCYLKTQFLFQYKDQSVTKMFSVILPIHSEMHRPILIEQGLEWGTEAGLDFSEKR